ncbi:MAG: alpha/beta hydrolase [Gammaproteobacteria bacterium]
MNFPTYIKRFFGTIITFLAVGLLVLNAWFYFLQPGMLFYPYKTLDAIPADWGLSYENVAITTSDNIQLHGWYLPNKKSKQVILFFHGNGGNISHRGDSLKIFHDLGLNVLIIDYRGYGMSEGELSEQGIYTDARAAWKYLQEKLGYKTSDIIIFGRSLGGAVAAKLSSQVKPRALILESTFSSVRDMASRALPVVSNFVYLRFGFNTESTIKRVTAPVLVVHSPDDEIIPYYLGQKVFNSANTPKYFYQLRGGHNDGFIQSMPGYREMLRTFIESL